MITLFKISYELLPNNQISIPKSKENFKGMAEIISEFSKLIRFSRIFCILVSEKYPIKSGPEMNKLHMDVFLP